MIRQSWLSFLFVLVVVLGSTTTTFAQSNTDMLKYALECDGSDFVLCAQPLLKGEKAPFDGQLLTPQLAISLSQQTLAFDIQLQLELERVQKLHEIEINYQKDINNLDKQGAKKQIDLLEKRLAESHKIAWYRSPIFVAVTSCAATVLVVVGATYLVRTID